MPKKIENIDQKILQAATACFQEEGYEGTDMKKIAHVAGTGVGNIYNYYKNKPTLFMEVGRLWRKNLVMDLRQILEGEGSVRERIRNLLVALYQNVEAWSGIWHEFMMKNQKLVFGKMGYEIKKEFEKEESILARDLQDVMMETLEPQSQARKILSADDGRFTTMMFMSIFMLPSRYPGQRKENLEFIDRYVDFFFTIKEGL